MGNMPPITRSAKKIMLKKNYEETSKIRRQGEIGASAESPTGPLSSQSYQIKSSSEKKSKCKECHRNEECKFFQCLKKGQLNGNTTKVSDPTESSASIDVLDNTDMSQHYVKIVTEIYKESFTVGACNRCGFLSFF